MRIHVMHLQCLTHTNVCSDGDDFDNAVSLFQNVRMGKLYFPILLSITYRHILCYIRSSFIAKSDRSYIDFCSRRHIRDDCAIRSYFRGSMVVQC